ncbi:MAG TPA: DUF2690 domain-containing protein [Streptomyces sp.]|nr:DUF2690 domain-containing protein [Streptomyces sp.]
MTTSSPDDGSTTPASPSPPDPSAPAPEPDAPTGPWQRWRARIGGATALAYSGVVVGAVAAAFLTPLGEHLVGGFFDDPTCPGRACDGKNPDKHECGQDARTYEPDDSNPAALQIRWSKDCHAVWGKIERGAKGDQVTVEVEGAEPRRAEINYGYDQFTSMVAVEDGGFEVKVCAIPGEGGKSTFRRYCVHATDAAAWQ